MGKPCSSINYMIQIALKNFYKINSFLVEEKGYPDAKIHRGCNTKYLKNDNTSFKQHLTEKASFISTIFQQLCGTPTFKVILDFSTSAKHCLRIYLLSGQKKNSNKSK